MPAIAGSVRRACWTATALGALHAGSALAGKQAGVLDAAIFWAAAWEIRNGHGWAAVAAAALASTPLLRSVLSGGGPGPGLAIVLAVDILLLLGAVDLFRGADPPPHARAHATVWITAAAAALGLSVALCPMVMPGESMEKTLEPGDRFLVNTLAVRLGWHPRRGDLVVFRWPVDRRQVLVKRVAAVAGDRLRIPAGRTASGEVTVPPGMLFVLGDNRGRSLNSRDWGFVPDNALIGRPVLIYGSANRSGVFLRLPR